MRPSTERIGKDIRASSNFFTRRAADVVYEGYFTAMTGYRHDEPATMDISMIAIVLTSDLYEFQHLCRFGIYYFNL